MASPGLVASSGRARPGARDPRSRLHVGSWTGVSLGRVRLLFAEKGVGNAVLFVSLVQDRVKLFMVETAKTEVVLEKYTFSCYMHAYAYKPCIYCIRTKAFTRIKFASS